jgi:2-haloacid dehalogenase
MKPRAFVFDAYGTLFDVHSVVLGDGNNITGDLKALSRLWRQKQLEYTWLRSLTELWDVTEAAIFLHLTSSLSRRTHGTLLELKRLATKFAGATEPQQKWSTLGALPTLWCAGSINSLSSPLEYSMSATTFSGEKPGLRGACQEI